MRRYLITAMLLALAAACDRAPAPADEVPRAESPRGEVPESGLAAFFEEGPIELPDSRAGIEAQLGAPDSVLGEAVANRHDPAVTDSILTVHYPGLVVGIYRAGYDGKEILASLQIGDDRYLRPTSPLRLGATATQIRAALGEPDEAGAERLEYVCDECLVAGQETVTLVLVRNALRRIDFRYWVD